MGQKRMKEYIVEVVDNRTRRFIVEADDAESARYLVEASDPLDEFGPSFEISSEWTATVVGEVDPNIPTGSLYVTEKNKTS